MVQPDQYKELYTATREYAKTVRIQDRWGAEQVHDFVLLVANTVLRPDEAKNLQHHDVKVVNDQATGERILEIVVRGKRGVGFCKSMPGCNPISACSSGKKPTPINGSRKIRIVPRMRRVIPSRPTLSQHHIKLFNGVLRRAKLKLDREGNKRTAYSLRHTYICMRLNAPECA